MQTSKPVSIAPAFGPRPDASDRLGANEASRQPAMPYSCQTCARRKVKCNKGTPICSACLKAKLDCFYQAPQPRCRKRKPNDEVLEKLARYERILRRYGLLDADTLSMMETTPSSTEEPAPDSMPIAPAASLQSTRGRLIADQSKSRYINSDFWGNFADDELHTLSDDDGEEGDIEGTQMVPSTTSGFSPDPLTGALMGYQQSLLAYHPSHEQAMALWRTYAENVEPICKILHIPSTATMVDCVSQQPATASKVQECILFAVYHFAIFSMTEDDCTTEMGMTRAVLLQRFQSATRQALVNASFLKTTELPVLQALVLFLMACRHTYDSHTYWILTGVVVRISQRMGIHRDGKALGLPPFDVQMRRRLFYQILPLDGLATQMSGTGIPIIPHDWDTQQPLNVNDDQIWPGMTDEPEENKGATEMIFCLSRSCLGTLLVKAGRLPNAASSWHFEDYTKAEQAITKAEGEVEETYIRYCDPVNPLHLLTASAIRAGITAARLRNRLPKVRNNIATDEDRKEILSLARKILDTDAVTYSHRSLKRYHWHVGSLFLWGTWDSLMFLLTSLWKRCDLFSPTDVVDSWQRIEQIFRNHNELMESRRALHVTFRRFTLKVWDARPTNLDVPEPPLINDLRVVREAEASAAMEKKNNGGNVRATGVEETSPAGVVSLTNSDTLSSGVPESTSFDTWSNFDVDAADWLFWEQLRKEDEANGIL